MESQREVYGNLQARVVGMFYGPSRQCVDPPSSGRIIVCIIVRAFKIGIYRVGKTRPLQPVTGTFRKTRVMACQWWNGNVFVRGQYGTVFNGAADISHPASEF